MNRLLKLAKQYYEWQGYLVQENVVVGLRESGKYDGVLNFLAYHPKLNRVLHIEFAARYESWDSIKAVMADQFQLGQALIFTEVFSRFTWRTDLKQFGVVIKAIEQEIENIPIISIESFVSRVYRDLATKAPLEEVGLLRKYDLLSELQLDLNRNKPTMH